MQECMHFDSDFQEFIVQQEIGISYVQIPHDNLLRLCLLTNNIILDVGK